MKYLIILWSIFLTIGCGPRIDSIEMESDKEFSVYRNLYAEINLNKNIMNATQLSIT